MQAPLTAQPIAAHLAPNEVLLEINTTGRSTTRADSAVIGMIFSATGSTTEEARRATEALSNRLLEVARRFGAERADDSSGMARVAFISDLPPEGVGPGAFIGNERADAGRGQRLGHGSLQLRLPNPARVAEFRSALEGAGALNVTAAYTVADNSAARQAAFAAALSQARREANEFAQANGMRVARMTRFSESADRQMEMMQTMAARMMGAWRAGTSAEVETNVWVQVSFALAPQ